MIQVDGLVRVLGDRRVLDGVTFTAPSGVVTGFLGPNGAGKTTTMRVIATLLRPTEGSVTIDGCDVVADADEVRRRIGLVTEEPSLLDRLTVREQLRFAGRAHGMASDLIAERTDALVTSLGLEAGIDARAGTLSKGNRQKAALARALLHDPPVLLFDEPTANLDIVAQAAIEELLTSPAVAAGKTVLLSTHAIDEAERLCDRVVGIAHGRVLVEGTKDDVVAAAGGRSFRDAFLALFAESSLSGPSGPQRAETDRG